MHPFIPLDGNYVKCLNACEPIVFHIPNGKKAQLLFLRPTDGLSSFDFLYEGANFPYKEDKQQQINFHYGCKVKTFGQKPVKNPAVCLVRLSERTSAFRAEKNGSTPLPSTTSPKYKGTNMQVMLRQVNIQVN